MYFFLFYALTKLVFTEIGFNKIIHIVKLPHISRNHQSSLNHVNISMLITLNRHHFCTRS